MSTKLMGMFSLVLSLGLLPGCMISQSVSKSVRTAIGSVSDSVQSVSDRVSANDEERLEREFRDDVRVAVRDLVELGATPDDFLRELGRIAELHGISDWESESGTLNALGAGVCEAGAGGTVLDALLERMGRSGAEDLARAHQGCSLARL